MNNMIQSQTKKYTKERRKKKLWQKVITVLAAVAVFCTTYALILPAITWERSLVCEIPEHRHVDSCYEIVAGEKTLVCGLEEHEHTAACFDAPPAEDDGYHCGQIEHVHSEEQNCYFSDGTLRCTIPEHRHTLVCKRKILKGTTIMSEPAEDGAVALVTGNIPIGAEVTIKAVGFSKKELTPIFGKDKAARMKSFVAYDIKILVDGEEWQPNKTVSVTVDHPDIDVPTEGLAVAHITSDDSAVVDVSSHVDKDGNICFDTNGFSVYVFYLFTVDYYYGDMEYHQDGMSTLYLSGLFKALGIDRSVKEVAGVEFTRPDLVRVDAVGGDWTLTSLQAFKSEEKVKVTFADGSVIEIKVFDDASVKMEVNYNYNLVSTVTDVELLLDHYNVRNALGLPENTTVKSVSVSPESTTSGNEFRVVTNTAGNQSIRCTKNFTDARTCTVVFNAQDTNGDDIACEFTNITANNDTRYTLWDYSNGKGGAGSPEIIQGNFENLITPINGKKEWKYPTSASDNSNIHTENAPIGFSSKVFTTEGRDKVSQYKINPIVYNGKTYYLYVSTNSTSINSAVQNYSSSATTVPINNVNLGRYSRQNCSLPCIKGNLLLVCWIEDEAGNKVVLPNVCIGNEGASNLWNWKFGGTGERYIFTNDGIQTGSGLKWNTGSSVAGATVAGSGTSVSQTDVHLFQGVVPDENGYYTVYMSSVRADGSGTDYVDELSVFQFVALSDVKKVVLDVSGNPVTGATKDFDFGFGIHYQPQVHDSSYGMTQDGKITEHFRLSDGESENVNGVVNSTFTVWEVVDPYYTTTIRTRVGNSTTTTALVTTTETVTEGGKTYERIRPTSDQSITAGTEKVTVEFVNQKKPTVFVNKTFTGLTLKQIAALRDNATDPFTITAVGQIGTFKLGLARSETDDLVDPYAISADGMTYTWELPIPGNYTITESGFAINGIECSTTVRSGNSLVSPNADGSYTIQITGSTSDAVTIENAYTHNTVPLTVTKTLYGNSADMRKRFPVRIKATDASGSPIDLNQYQEAVVANVTFKKSDEDSDVFDIVEFTVADGEGVTIMMIPGAKVEITETAHSGYSVKIAVTDTGGGGQLDENASGDRYVISSMPEFAVTAAITNTSTVSLPETGGIGKYSYYILGTSLVGVALIYGYILRRKRERRSEKRPLQR